MAQQMITVGAFLNDPSAESVHSAFLKVDAMTLEQFTGLSLGGRQDIDTDASPDTIRTAFQKTNTNISALYSAQGLSGIAAVTINVGAALDDQAADSIQAAFTKVNQAFQASYAAVPTGSVIAFPGAQGFGSLTRHAYAGSATPTISRVTNLNDSGTGSLRAAVEGTLGPRIVIFETSGTIVLSTKLIVTSPYLYVAGQTAPNPGITLRGAGVSIRAHNIVLRHFRIRVGDDVAGDAASNRDGLEWLGPQPTYVGAGTSVADHMSVSWGLDETMSTWHAPTDITISNSIISEGLLQPIRSKGFLIGNNTKRVTLLRSLLAHSWERNGPEFNEGSEFISVNNVMYDWADASSQAPLGGGGGSTNPRPNKVSFAGNVFIRGASYTAGTPSAIRFRSGGAAGAQWYINDTRLVGTITLFRNDGTYDPRVASPPIWSDDVTLLSSAATEAHVLANAGARPLNRDSVDARIVNQVSNRTGRIVNSQNDVGGWPTLAVNPRALTVPTNPHGISASGYTNLEVWLQTFADALEP